MFKIYKIMFINFLIIGTLITISSNSWLGAWMGLEINLMSIIPLMASKKNIMSNESMMKYFIVQALASTLILMSITLMTLNINFSNLMIEDTCLMTMNSALLTKTGMAPFHFWFPEVMEGLSWLNCLLIMTWQKIAPMVLLLYNINQPIFLMTIVIISSMISGIMGINQISMRKILAFSSINHMAWMMSSMMSMKTIWIQYFIIYSLTSMNIVLMMKHFNLSFLNQIPNLKMNKSSKIILLANFLSLSGIPPTLGFLPKWLTIQFMVQEKMIMLTIIIILATMIMIYMYIRVILSTLVLSNNLMMPSKTPQNSKNYQALMNFIIVFSMIIILMMNIQL